MTLDDYTAIGGFKNALSNHADETFWKLDQTQQKIATQMFRRLSHRQADRGYMTTFTPINAIASIAEVSVADVIAVVESFRHPERRFLIPDAAVPLDANSVVALSHESLVRQWHRLERWIEQEARAAAMYRHLEHTARLWQQGETGLWRTPDLEHALTWKHQEKPTAAWAEQYGDDFTLAMKFLDASARKKTLKWWLLMTLIGIAFIIAASLAFWGGWERSKRIRAENTLATQTPVPKAPVEGLRIRQVAIRDMKGLTVSSINQRYLLKPREKVEIGVTIDNPFKRKFTLEYYQFTEGTTGTDATYTVPDMPGRDDMVIIKAVDVTTGEIIDQTPIRIKIVNTR